MKYVTQKSETLCIITDSIIYNVQFLQTAFKNIFVGVSSKLLEASFDLTRVLFQSWCISLQIGLAQRCIDAVSN